MYAQAVQSVRPVEMSTENHMLMLSMCQVKRQASVTHEMCDETCDETYDET